MVENVENRRTKSSDQPSSSKSKKTSKTPLKKTPPTQKPVPKAKKPKDSAKVKKAKVPGKNKGKTVAVKDTSDELEEDSGDELHDPEDPAFEPDAEEYPLKPGPLPNECLKELDHATYDFTTKIYSLARQYGRRPQELFDASGQSYSSKRQPSTWNCFQAYMCIEKGWQKRPDESREQFVQRLAAVYENKLKKALGHEWQRVDLRRLAMRKYTEWYQRNREEQIEADRERKGGSTLRMLNKAVREVNKLQRVLYEANDFVVMAEIHDLNNYNRSKFTGYGPEYKEVMKTQKVAFTKQLKVHSALLVVARSEEEQGRVEERDEDIVQIISLYDAQPDDLTNLRSLMPRAWGVDLKLATNGTCSKMRWKGFGSHARSNHVRVKEWPAGLPGIGPKADGLVENIKSFSKPVLVKWMKTAAKREESLTKADEKILDQGFEGPYIEAWTEEETNGEVDEGDVPLIVDDEGNEVLRVRDILKDHLLNDDDDDNNDNDHEEQPETAPTRRRPNKPTPAAVSSGSKQPPTHIMEDDSDDTDDVQPSRRQKPLRNDGESDTDDEENFMPPPASRLPQRAQLPSSKKQLGTAVIQTVDSEEEEDQKGSNDIQESDSDSDSDLTERKPLANRKGKQPVYHPSKSVTSQTTTTAHPTKPRLAPTSSKRFITNAGSVVSNFVEKHRQKNVATSSSHPPSRGKDLTQAGPSGNKKRKGEDDGGDEMQPSRKKKKTSTSNPLPASSHAKSYTRADFKKIQKK
ncbi:hypothetical protein K435DRAFT_805766 [Dendrothele bispora CBS 962.96]|uniref:Uncharacterized protein n=1 Tax=Dendrothele bispora (strain CBS 962.96) TaxID=1314807 RepID=A0A4S8L9Y9_DENBC|nr:hypothetical protein K435DRAFT_805766 [Dendrothele bispora CBS 962.96]